MTGYFLPSNLGNAGTAANTIWSYVVPYNADASINYTNFPQDQTAQSAISSYLSSIPSDPSDPTTFYVLANDYQATSKTVLLSGHYDAMRLDHELQIQRRLRLPALCAGGLEQPESWCDLERI